MNVPHRIETSIVLDHVPNPMDCELTTRRERLAELKLESARPLERIDLERVAVEGIPQTPFLRAPYLAENDVTILAMKPGDGKSTFAYVLAYALASGTPFLDAPETDPVPVGIIDGESGSLEASRLALTVGPPIPDLHLFSVSGIALSKPGDAASIEREIVLRGLKVLIFDSISSTFGLSDENDAAQVSRVMAIINAWRDRHGCAIVLLHHLNKGSADNVTRSRMDRVRGSSAFSALASAVFYGERAPGGTYIDLCCAGKARGRSTVFTARVELIHDGERIGLHSLGTPERADTVLEAAGADVRAYLVGCPDLRAKRKVVVNALADRMDEDTADRARKHLERLGILLSGDAATRGYWQLAKIGSNE